MNDIDAWLIDSITVNDGVLGLVGFDDDRPMATWSTPHYHRAVAQVAICTSRLSAVRWARTDVVERHADAAVVAKADGEVATATAQLAAWEAQLGRLEQARSRGNTPGR